MLEILKNIYPSKSLPNMQPFPGQVNMDSAIMISREQERINLLLISFIKTVVKKELANVQSLDKVDFLREDSVIGVLFYRILKSQEKNVDTVCSVLAHLMNGFISMLQDGQDFETQNNQEANAKGAKG